MGLCETEADWEFLQLSDLVDYQQDLFETALENFEEIAFDVFIFCNIF